MKLAICLVVLAVGGAEVYRWVDPDGVVHFSDMPQAGAERIVIESAPSPGSAPSGSPGPGSAQGASGPAGSPSASYETVTIQSPSQNQNLWNIGGQLDVALSVSPPLQAGDSIQLLLDGQVAQTLDPGSTATQLSAVYRGSHTLQAQVLDSGGNVRALSPTVGFVVHQTSIQNPQNPQTPKPTPR